MPSPVHFPPQQLGTAVSYDVDIASASGANVAFAGTEALAASIVPVAGGDAVATPTFSWTTPASGIATLAIDADPALFAPTVYRVEATVEVAGTPRPIFPADAFVAFLPGPGAAHEAAMAVRTGTAPYCTVEQFLRHVDADFAGQLVRDTGEVRDADELDFDAVVEEALKAASGEVESAATRGEFYTPADLAALAASGGNGAAFLRSLVADIACVRLRMRRAFVGEPLPQERRAIDLLDALSRGVRIFPFREVQVHGRPASRFATAAERAAVGYVTDDDRFWGRRSGAYRGLF